ncbi:hypothetical protein [Streptomyces graminilatus]|uniref:hypothetical protein n=1 Tax=Streptomyces graminilatus TaxID=1464070 RepID=UPI0006E1D7B0|nr:hypothetical protein [Streptomyces graminilatus]
MKRALALLGAALTATALLMTACSSGLEQGPPGRVVAKDRDYECHTTGTGKKRHRSCHFEYELTTRDKDGQEHEFEVSSSVYDDCHRGSSYPACTTR